MATDSGSGPCWSKWPPAACSHCLYVAETQWQNPLVLGANFVQPRADFLTTNLALAAHLRFVSHAILVSLMLVASLIDVDERTIPDSITISGAVAGLVMAAAYPWSLLEAGRWLVADSPAVEFVTLASPEPWPNWLNGGLLPMPLAIGLGCWTLWCVGLMPRYFPLRRGWSMAAHIFCHRLRKAPITYLIFGLWVVGAAGISVVAWRAPKCTGRDC